MWKGSQQREALTDCDILDHEYNRFQNDVEQEYAHFPNGHEMGSRHAASAEIQPSGRGHRSPAHQQDHQEPIDTVEYSIKSEVAQTLKAVIRPGGSDNYIPWSIINTLFCGVVIGLVALVFSIKSATHHSNGNRVLAKKYSYIAYLMNILATLLGAVTYITLYILYCATDIFGGTEQITWFSPGHSQ